MTSRQDDTITETNTDNKPERPKPPTSLLTDTLQAITPTQIPIVSPDRYTCLYTHMLQYKYAHSCIHSSTQEIQLIVFSVYSPQTDREKDPDYDSLPSQTSQSESSMLQVICRPEATNKEDAYTFHTVHSKQPPLNS